MRPFYRFFLFLYFEIIAFWNGRYKSAILGSIVRLNSPPGSRPGTFVRNGNEVVGLVSEIGAAGSEGRESQVIAETDGSLDAEKSSAAQ